MIWCVEDDPSIREIEVYALQSTGFQALGFENGDDFWVALEERVPDLVILDVMLHRARLELQSSPGEGTLIRLIL